MPYWVFKCMTTALIRKREIENVLYRCMNYIWIFGLFQKKKTSQYTYFKTSKSYRIFIFFTALAFNKRFDVSEYGMADLDDLLSELPATSIVVNSVSRISLVTKVAYLINNILKKMSLCWFLLKNMLNFLIADFKWRKGWHCNSAKERWVVWNIKSWVLLYHIVYTLLTCTCIHLCHFK